MGNDKRLQLAALDVAPALQDLGAWPKCWRHGKNAPLTEQARLRPRKGAAMSRNGENRRPCSALGFHTDAGSGKGAEIADNPVAVPAWCWKSRERQVRGGPVQEVPAAEPDACFRSRPLQSRRGAWASQQSRPIESRDALMRNLQIAAERFPEDPPRPEWRRGYTLWPLEIEFWVQGACRLHDRALSGC